MFELVGHIIITPRACARDKAICRRRHEIARSGVLSICSCCNYHELVDIGEKLVSVRFKLLNMAH